jgi:predicted O-methyltransferase YrrM
MRTYSDIEQMAGQDYSIGLTAHYKPLAQFLKERGYKTGIEIGTAYGGNAYHLLQNTELDNLTCIDPYLYYPAMPGFSCQEEYDKLHQFAIDRLSGFPNASIVRIDSYTFYNSVAKDFKFDFVFLDGSHDYEDVKWECENYSKIIKPGGVLSGHDYNIFEGVNKAVDEFAKAEGKPVELLPGNIWYINY